MVKVFDETFVLSDIIQAKLLLSNNKNSYLIAKEYLLTSLLLRSRFLPELFWDRFLIYYLFYISEPDHFLPILIIFLTNKKVGVILATLYTYCIYSYCIYSLSSI